MRNGELPFESNRADPAPDPRPAYHFVFGLRERPQPFHLIFYLCLESCRQINQPSRIYLHCHHLPFGPYWERIRDAVTVVPVRPDPFIAAYRYPQAWLNRYRYAHHADVVRLDALLQNGGIYTDLDTLFIHPVPAALRGHACVLGREDDVFCDQAGGFRSSLCNAVIMAQPGSAFLRAWRERLYAAFDGTWSRHSGFLAEDLSRELPTQIHIEPRRTFYKHSFRPAGVQMLLEGLDPDCEGVVSMHLWSHLWWDRRRRDYSRIHAGMLTEEYIRSVDTTYNVLARRYLPPAGSKRPSLASRLIHGWRAAPAGGEVGL